MSACALAVLFADASLSPIGSSLCPHAGVRTPRPNRLAESERGHAGGAVGLRRRGARHPRRALRGGWRPCYLQVWRYETGTVQAVKQYHQ